jgi:hypothetical protein
VVLAWLSALGQGSSHQQGLSMRVHGVATALVAIWRRRRQEHHCGRHSQANCNEQKKLFFQLQQDTNQKHATYQTKARFEPCICQQEKSSNKNIASHSQTTAPLPVHTFDGLTSNYKQLKEKNGLGKETT